MRMYYYISLFLADWLDNDNSCETNMGYRQGRENLHCVNCFFFIVTYIFTENKLRKQFASFANIKDLLGIDTS
jgi:hypothetical protein